MNNYCKKCGKELGSEDKFCSGCGTPVNGEMLEVETTEPTQEMIKKRKEDEKKHVFLIFGLLGGSILCHILSTYIKGTLLSTISIMLALASFVAMITGRVKYKDNAAIKAVLISTVLGVIFYFALIALFIYICIRACGNILENPPTNCG